MKQNNIGKDKLQKEMIRLNQECGKILCENITLGTGLISLFTNSEQTK